MSDILEEELSASFVQPYKSFKGEQIGRPAIDAARDMLVVLNQLPLSESGSFYSYSGEKLPW